MAIEKIFEEKYQKGFNEGYLIAKHLPDLSDSLAKVKSNTPWMEGFHEGRLELVMEEVKDKAGSQHQKATEKIIQPFKSKEDRDPER